MLRTGNCSGILTREWKIWQISRWVPYAFEPTLKVICHTTNLYQIYLLLLAELRNETCSRSWIILYLEIQKRKEKWIRTNFNKRKKNLSTSTIDKSFNVRQKSTNIWITTKLLSYHLINLGSNIIYVLFIVELSYEDLIRNLSNIVCFFDLSLTSYTVLIVNWSIHQTKRLFFFHLIRFYINARTIDLHKYNIILYAI